MTIEKRVLLKFRTRSDSLRIDMGMLGGTTLSMVLRASRTCHSIHMQRLKDAKSTPIQRHVILFCGALRIFVVYSLSSILTASFSCVSFLTQRLNCCRRGKKMKDLNNVGGLKLFFLSLLLFTAELLSIVNDRKVEDVGDC